MSELARWDYARWLQERLGGARERIAHLETALWAISDRGDMEPFDDRGAAVLVAIARDALAAGSPAERAYIQARWTEARP